MAKNDRMVVPGGETEKDMIFGKINQANLAKMNSLVAQLLLEGKATQIDLYPSLNKALSGAGTDAFYAGIVKDNRKDAMNSQFEGKEDEMSDAVTIESLMGDGLTVNFYAGNKGLKAKCSALQKGWGVIIQYKGDEKSKNTLYRDWHNYSILAFEKKTDLADLLLKIAA